MTEFWALARTGSVEGARHGAASGLSVWFLVWNCWIGFRGNYPIKDLVRKVIMKFF